MTTQLALHVMFALGINSYILAYYLTFIVYIGNVKNVCLGQVLNHDSRYQCMPSKHKISGYIINLTSLQSNKNETCRVFHIIISDTFLWFPVCQECDVGHYILWI